MPAFYFQQLNLRYFRNGANKVIT